MALFPSFQNADPAICFADRQAAGEQLAQAVLSEIKQVSTPNNTPRCIVYALPRGGIPVAEPIARLLGCPLDLVVAKKITRSDNPELAIGAVTADGFVVWALERRTCHATAESSSEPLSHSHTAELQTAQALAQSQLSELATASPPDPLGAIALVVDDGIATGMTIAAAVQALRAQQPAQIWICAPVAPLELMPFLKSLSDQVIVLATPNPFYSVSRFYKTFPQVSTQEAAVYLQQLN